MEIICSHQARVFLTREFDTNRVKYSHSESGINFLNVEDTPKARLAIQLAKGKNLKLIVKP